MKSSRARIFIALFLALCLAAFAAACGSSEDEEDIAEDENEEQTETAAAKYKPSGKEGTIAGVINFEGTPPAPISIAMDADSACAASNPNPLSEDVVVKDGKLQNVFVYIKDGKTTEGGRNIAALSFDAPTEPKILDQKGCQYTPHVVGVQAGQKLSVTNSDKTTHNVNVQAKVNPPFNQSQTAGQGPIEKVFARPELIPVKCNQHPWMKAYLNVLKHPFFSVSGEGGKFEIKGVPPGTYTLIAWHEKLGEKSQSVTVGPSESKSQDFSFAGTGTTTSLQNSSLELAPAIEFPMLGHGAKH